MLFRGLGVDKGMANRVSIPAGSALLMAMIALVASAPIESVRAASHSDASLPATTLPRVGVRSLPVLRVSSPFGRRRDPFVGNSRPHEGIDLPGRFGTSVHATGSGVISYAGWMNGYGNLIQIEHEGGLSTRYGHLSRILVHDGEQVHQGDVIGRMGSTGRSTGNHLHYEIRRAGQPVNPQLYIGRSVASTRPTYDEKMDIVELGTKMPGAPATPRWGGFTDTSSGLPRAIIR